MPSFLKVIFYKIVLLSFFVKPIHSLSQSQNLINYKIENGIPSNEIYDIIEDNHGFLWLSTDKGLSRYNGYKFENFGLRDGLLDAVIFDFFKDDSGRIWCSSNSNYVIYFEGVSPTFKSYTFNDTIQKYAKDLISNGLLIDSKGELFMSFHHYSGLLNISPQGEIKSIPKRAKGEITPTALMLKDQSICFYEDQSEVQPFHYPLTVLNWKDSFMSTSRIENSVSANQKTAILGSDSTLIVFAKNEKNVLKKNKKIIAVGILDDEHYWVGFALGGCEILNTTGEQSQQYLSKFSVSQVFKDSQSNTWVSTLENGLFMLKEPKININHLTSSLDINTLNRDSKGHILIGGNEGSIYKYTENSLQTLYQSKKVHQAFIEYSYKDSINYYSTDKIFSDHEIFLNPNVSNHFLLSQEKFLLTGIFGSQVVDVNTGKIVNVLFKNQRILDVIEFNGLVFGAGNKGVFKSSSLQDTSYDILFQNRRTNDLEIFNNYLLLGTNGFGVQVMNSQEKIEFTLDEKSGLASNFINKIKTLNDSTVWIASNQGISIITYSKTQKIHIENLSISDGLSTNEIRDIFFLRDTAWIATSAGLNFIDLDKLEKIDNEEHSLKLIWLDSILNGHENQAENFGYSQNDFEFNFLGIRLKGGEKLIYSYQLQGYGNEAWNFTTSPQVHYTNLPPDDYLLKVRLYVGNGEKYENEIIYMFSISPPFWSSWWFICLCIIVGTGTIYLFFKIRVLTYNADIVRAILRALLARLRSSEAEVLIRQNGENIKVRTANIHYIKTDGNYLEVYTNEKRFYTRSSLSNFMDKIPDKLEFIQVHRKYIVRIDKIESKGNMKIKVLGVEIPVGRKYSQNIENFEI